MKSKLLMMSVIVAFVACGGGAGKNTDGTSRDNREGGDNFKPTPTTGAADNKSAAPSGDERGLGRHLSLKIRNTLLRVHVSATPWTMLKAIPMWA